MKQDGDYSEAQLRFLTNGPGLKTVIPFEEMTIAEKEELQERYKMNISTTKKDQLKELWQDWLTDKHWEGIYELSKIPPFDKPSIIDHMIEHHRDWKKYIREAGHSTVPVPMPGPYCAILSKNEQQKKRDLYRKITKRVDDMKGYYDEMHVIAKIFKLDEPPEDRLDSEDELVPDRRSKRLPSQESQNSQNEENEEMFIKRRNYIEEDEFIGKVIVDGLPQFNEFKVQDHEIPNEEKEQMVINLKKALHQFCIMRIFRPDLMQEEMRHVVQQYLGVHFLSIKPLEFEDIVQKPISLQPHLLILQGNIDPHQELLRMRHVYHVHIGIVYKTLSLKNIKKLPQILMAAAKEGYWLLLDNVSRAAKYMPMISKLVHQMLQLGAENRHRKEREVGYRRKRAAAEKKPEPESERENKDKVDPKKPQEIALELPADPDFLVSGRFKLWVAMRKDESLDPSVLYDYNKIVVQSLQGLRQSTQQIVQQTPTEQEQACPTLGDTYRRIFFAITLFHSVINGRRRFRKYGWNQEYDFSFFDNQLANFVTISQLRELEGDAAKVGARMTLIKYMISELVYGGKISNQHDQVVLEELLSTFINKRLLAKHGAVNFAEAVDRGDGSLASYVLPKQATGREQLMQHIRTYPEVDRPEMYGLHQNANLSTLEHQGLETLKAVFKFQFEKRRNVLKDSVQKMDPADANKMKRYKRKLKDLEDSLPSEISERDTKRSFPISYEDSIAIMMHREVQKYNSLLRFISNRLAVLFKFSEGQQLLDDDMQEELQCIICDRTPPGWLNVSFSGSPTLPAYMENLKERIDYINSLISTRRQGPQLFKFWMPGFYDPSNLLTLLLQHEARKVGKQLDEMTFVYRVTDVCLDDQGP